MEQPLIQMDAATGTGVALFRYLSQDIEACTGLETIASSMALLSAGRKLIGAIPDRTHFTAAD